MGGDVLGGEGRAAFRGCDGVLGDEALEGVGAEAAAAGAGEDERGCVVGLLVEPGAEHRDDVGSQGCAACLAAFSEAADVRAGAECDVRVLQGGEFGATESGLEGDEQEGPVASADPGGGVGCGDERSALFLVEELYGAALGALAGHGEHALAVQGVGWFLDRDVAEEGSDGGEAEVAGARRTAALGLEGGEEVRQERGVEIVEQEVGGASPKLLGGESQQQAKGVTVAGDGVWAGAELPE